MFGLWYQLYATFLGQLQSFAWDWQFYSTWYKSSIYSSKCTGDMGFDKTPIINAALTSMADIVSDNPGFQRMFKPELWQFRLQYNVTSTAGKQVSYMYTSNMNSSSNLALRRCKRSSREVLALDRMLFSWVKYIQANQVHHAICFQQCIPVEYCPLPLLHWIFYTD